MVSNPLLSEDSSFSFFFPWSSQVRVLLIKYIQNQKVGRFENRVGGTVLPNGVKVAV